MENELQQFRQQIATSFNEDDLRDLAFDLSLDWDELQRSRKSTIVTDIIIRLHRFDRLPELITYLQEARPQVTWPRPDQLAPHLDQMTPGENTFDASFPLVNLPPVNPHFSGRTQLLEDLQTVLDNQEATIAITQAITGLGGVGKTQLALEFAHRNRQKYDLVWWLNASDATQLDNDLRFLGQRLRLPLPPDDLPAARQLVLSWLSSTDRHWLLIYDNVDSMTTHELYSYRPGGLGHALITSRNPHWRGQALVLDVNVFSPQEATDFFQVRLELADEPYLNLLAEELGYLPLALEHAAAYLETRQVTAAVYLELFQTRRKELWVRAQPPDAYHATITTTWNISFEQAKEVPGSAELLALCCFLAPDDIPLQELARSLAKIEPFAETGLSDDLTRADAVAVLRRYALLNGTEKSLHIHRLVQMVYRDQVGKDRAKAWLAAVVDLILDAWPNETRLHEWKIGQRVISHLVTLNQLARDLSWETKKAAHIANETGLYLEYLANYAAAKPYIERALDIYEKLVGPEHPYTATSLNNLGALLKATGDYAIARQHLERALAIRKKVLGAEHPATAGSLNNLGALLSSTGDYTAARHYYERALVIREKVLGPEHLDTVSSLNNLGLLFQTTGDYVAARPYFERALAIQEKVLGLEHPDIAISLNNLGNLLRVSGDYAAARKHLERALTIWENVLGPEHPHTAATLNNLGFMFQDIGDYATARPYCERALAIAEKALGPEHPNTANSLSNMGFLLKNTGDYASARPYYERALAIRKKVLGEEHPDTVTNLNNIGALLKATSDYAAARPYFELALAIQEKVLGEEHPDTVINLNNIGALLKATSDYAAARPYFERALAIQEKVLGEEHPDTAQSLNNLGFLSQITGDHVAARPYFERALAICDKLLGPGHPNTLVVKSNLDSLIDS